jgi:hypothetical protein
MLSPTKKVLSKYKPFLMKLCLGQDKVELAIIKTNFDSLFNVHLLFKFTCLLPLHEIVHAWIKKIQKQDVFVCDYVLAIKVCQSQLYIV